MSSAVEQHNSASRVGRGRLWFGFLGGILAWMTHLMLAYGIAEFGCLSATAHTSFLGLTAVTWMLLVLSAATLAVAAWATLVAYRSGRQLPSASLDADEAAPPGGYMATAGVVMSGLSTFFIIVESIPIFYYLGDC